MVSETPQYPQVTPEQIQLWEADPVTKVYLQCLDWYHKDVEDDAKGDKLVDSSSAHLSHGLKHINLGQQQGLSTSMDYQSLFDRFEMVLLPKEEDDEDS